MRISVLHSTIYQYDSPVFLEPHIFRLRPREDGLHRLIRHELEIVPQPEGQSICLDAYGNVVVQAWFTGSLSEAGVRNSFEIETLSENPFDFLLPESGVLALPPKYDHAERPVLAPYMVAADPVRDFAELVAVQADGQTLPFLDALNRRLHRDWTHVLRPEGPPAPPLETLRNREGSCRDLSVLFCAACRQLGIAARFVSGYEKESAFQEHAYMHAWAEVYIPGGGWRGYDPSRGIAVSTSHVPVAAAVDAASAAPVTGSYRGASAARMQVSISMQVAG